MNTTPSPKPQTPLTDAHYHPSRSDRWLKKDENFARSLELKLQEAEEKLTVLIPEYTKAETKYKRLTVENLEYDVSLTQERETNLSLRQQLQEAERQLDESRQESVNCNYYKKALLARSDIKEEQAVKAERDQLIRVVDELARATNEGRPETIKRALANYSLLPHVQAKKGQA